MTPNCRTLRQAMLRIAQLRKQLSLTVHLQCRLRNTPLLCYSKGVVSVDKSTPDKTFGICLTF